MLLENIGLCDNLTVIGPYKLICGTTRKYVIAGVGMALLQEVCPRGDGL